MTLEVDGRKVKIDLGMVGKNQDGTITSLVNSRFFDVDFTAKSSQVSESSTGKKAVSSTRGASRVQVLIDEDLRVRKKIQQHQNAFELLARWRDQMESSWSRDMKETLDLLGHPEQEVFGGTGPLQGALSQLPKSTRSLISQQLENNWKRYGFESKDQADLYLSRARISATNTSVNLGFCYGQANGLPAVSLVQLDRN